MTLQPNKIHCGDNLEILRTFPDDSIDLIYLDPPFFSQKNYEQIWGDEAEIRSFSDRWAGGITHYIGWMSDRLKQLHRILKPTGSIYLHCDWHASHYLKLKMDDIFGEANFQNEIIWHYRGRGMQKNKFQRKHDVIFFYSKTKEFIFNSDNVKVPLDPEHVSRYNKIDEDGKKYALIKKKGGEHYKVYLKEDGIVMDDVWDLPFIHGNESLGYPTQKPEALLSRIILASSNEGDIVLDPFCGCGTTLAVAKKLKRQYIGIDVSPIACKLMAKRIEYDEVNIIGMPMSIEDLKKLEPYEFQQWVCDKMLAKNTSSSSKKHSGPDDGIDGIVSSNNREVSGEYIGAYIEVKHFKEGNNIGIGVIQKLYAVMMNDNIKKGFVIGFSFGSGAVEQVAKYKTLDNPTSRVEIILVKADELCKILYYDYGVKPMLDIFK